MLQTGAFCIVAICVMLCIPTRVHAAAACTVTVANINFGNVDVLPGTAFTVTGSMVVSCTGLNSNGTYRFCANIGSGANFSGAQRQMKAGVNSLNYDLYQDATFSTLWGSWQTGFDTKGLQSDITASGTTINTSIPIYAKLFPSQQTAATGSYSSAFPNSASGVDLTYGVKGGTTCPTGAGSTFTGFSALATVIKNCQIAATNVSFGTVGLLTSNKTATGTVSAQCNNAVPYTLSLNGGLTNAGNPTLRKMANGAQQVTYGLYQDAAHLNPWGSTVGTNTVAGTGSGVTQNYTVYGLVAPQSTGTPGNYSDTIIATVTF